MEALCVSTRARHAAAGEFAYIVKDDRLIGISGQSLVITVAWYFSVAAAVDQ